MRNKLTELDRLYGQRVGKQIADARAKAGEPAQAVAETAAVSIDALRSIETGRVPTPSFLTVARIAGVLGLSLDDLHAKAAGLWHRREPGPK